MNDASTSLARLEAVNVRTIWPDEAQDFTRWLAEEENLALLGRTLGMEIELERTEVAVGSFSADLVAVDTADNRRILIENQLEKTDHKHLGQTLTYAAGLNAPTVVWIAKQFTDEHRAALEWLNGITGADIRFFGLEIEVWKIGESPCAPKFNIVAKPNDWTKTVSVPKGELTEVQQAQVNFWRGFHSYAQEHASKIAPTAPRPQHWMGIAIGRSGFRLQAIASSWSYPEGQPEIRAELVIAGSDSARRFKEIEKARERIDDGFGAGELEWHAPDDAQQRKIYVRQGIDWLDGSRHEECHAWLVEKLDLLYEVFHERIRSLPTDISQPASSADDEIPPDEDAILTSE